MVQHSSEKLAVSIANITKDLDHLRYELETVRDMEEAVRVARRVEEGFLALAFSLETSGDEKDLRLDKMSPHGIPAGGGN